jgi:hypothetical protein
MATWIKKKGKIDEHVEKFQHGSYFIPFSSSLPGYEFLWGKNYFPTGYLMSFSNACY